MSSSSDVGRRPSEESTTTCPKPRRHRTAQEWDTILNAMSSDDDEDDESDQPFDGKSVSLLSGLRNANRVVENISRFVDPALVPDDLKEAHKKAVTAPERAPRKSRKPVVRE